MTIARSLIPGSLLALGLTLGLSGAFADGGHRAAEPVPCQTCQPHDNPRADPHADQHPGAQPDYRPWMVPADAQPRRTAPPPAATIVQQRIPGIVILLGSL